MSLALSIDFVGVATADIMTVSLSDKTTLEVAIVVGKGMTDERPSMFNAVVIGTTVSWAFITAGSDAVWTAEVVSIDKEPSGTLDGVLSKDALADPVFRRTVADDPASPVGLL